MEGRSLGAATATARAGAGGAARPRQPGPPGSARRVRQDLGVLRRLRGRHLPCRAAAHRHEPVHSGYLGHGAGRADPKALRRHRGVGGHVITGLPRGDGASDVGAQQEVRGGEGRPNAVGAAVGSGTSGAVPACSILGSGQCAWTAVLCQWQAGDVSQRGFATVRSRAGPRQRGDSPGGLVPRPPAGAPCSLRDPCPGPPPGHRVGVSSLPWPAICTKGGGNLPDGHPSACHQPECDLFCVCDLGL